MNNPDINIYAHIFTKRDELLSIPLSVIPPMSGLKLLV